MSSILTHSPSPSRAGRLPVRLHPRPRPLPWTDFLSLLLAAWVTATNSPPLPDQTAFDTFAARVLAGTAPNPIRRHRHRHRHHHCRPNAIGLDYAEVLRHWHAVAAITIDGTTADAIGHARLTPAAAARIVRAFRVLYPTETAWIVAAAHSVRPTGPDTLPT